MPRNRSEKSVSGDPVLDEYLRAFIRSQTRRNAPDGPELRRRHDALCQALTDEQRSTIRALGEGGYLRLGQARELFRHEPEFNDATK